MNKLKEDYWNQPVFINKSYTQKGNGEGFEDLIESLLGVIYGVKWNRTKKTHDNNRDFWVLFGDNKLWAECKNYRKTIDMKILAPTLVMAQVFDVNEILFFSRSVINRFAKDKILSYGEKNYKRIVFYDGPNLENLICIYQNCLPEKFSPKEYIEKTDDSKIAPEQFVRLYFFRNAISRIQSVADSFQLYTEADCIHYNEMFSLIFCIENPFPYENAELSIEFADENRDRFCFQYFYQDIFPDRKQWFNTILGNREGKAVVLNMRQIKYKSNICLPLFRVTIRSSNGNCMLWSSNAVTVKSSWVGQTRLIGSEYLRILEMTEQRLLNNPNLSVLLITGSSGTGKTRMINECQSIYLKEGYKIISFAGIKDYSSCFLLRELISFLYEIPSEDILGLLEQKFSSELMEETDERFDKEEKSIQLLRQIIKANTEEELGEILSKFADILYNKIARDKYVLVVDNVQFVGKTFLYFIEQYINSAVNQQSNNHSVLLLAFNLDYMTTKCSELVYRIMHVGIKNMLSFELQGFNKESKGIEFLQELTRTNKDENVGFFKTIINKVSLNPYNLYQTVKYLEEMDIIKITPNERGYIASNFEQYNLVSKLSSGISDVLDNRFKFIATILSRDRVILICSIIYIFDSINPHIKDIFGIKTLELDCLCKRSILRKIDNIFYFDHDIIRQYFYQSHSEKVTHCLSWLKKHGSIDKICRYPIPFLLYRISVEKDTETIIDTSKKLYNIEIPERYVSLLSNKLLEGISQIIEEGIYEGGFIKYIHQICTYIRKYDGSESAWYKAKEIINTIRAYCPYALSDNAEYYRPFIHFCCDIAAQIHLYDQERDLIKMILNDCKNTIPKDEKNRDELYVLQAIMYNRWYISYNIESFKEEIMKKRQALMEKSREFAHSISDVGKSGLIEYLNNSDEGYNYYGYLRDKNQLFNIWNNCITDIPKLVPEKTLNYYRKIVQYGLINHDLDSVVMAIKKARDYLQNGEYSHEPVVFETFFQMAEVMINLQCSPQKYYLYNYRIIEDILRWQKLLNNHKLGDILLLKGVNAHYSGKKEDVYYSYKEAYNYFISGETSRFWIKKDLLEENIMYSFSVLGIYDSEYDVSSFPERCRIQLTDTEIRKFKASGIQRTGDLHLNLPLI